MKKGTTRFVFLIGKYAIKIPRLDSWRMFLNGLLSNMQEWAFWNELHSKFLAKIYYANSMGFILIMERADMVYTPIDHPVESPTKQEIKELKKFFKQCKKSCLPVDEHFANVGLFNGKKKLIDYGN